MFTPLRILTCFSRGLRSNSKSTYLKDIHAVVPSPSGGATWTQEELTAALADPKTKQEYIPALLQANTFIQRLNEAGNVQDTVEVTITALDISTWTQSDLIEALASRSTDAALIPYLEKAYTELEVALEKGETRDTVYIVTPVGLIPPKANYE